MDDEGPTDARSTAAARELALARASAGGDRRSLEELLSLLYEQVYSICRRVCLREGDAEDATQEALIKIAKGIARFDGRSAVRTWAYRIATNAALDEIRSSQRRSRPSGSGDELMETAARINESGDSMDTRVSDRLDIDAALARLQPEFRVAVVLRDVVGMDYGEIGETLGIAPGTVRSRISRGRHQLQTFLQSGNQLPTPLVESNEP